MPPYEIFPLPPPVAGSDPWWGGETEDGTIYMYIHICLGKLWLIRDTYPKMALFQVSEVL